MLCDSDVWCIPVWQTSLDHDLEMRGVVSRLEKVTFPQLIQNACILILNEWEFLWYSLTHFRPIQRKTNSALLFFFFSFHSLLSVPWTLFRPQLSWCSSFSHLIICLTYLCVKLFRKKHLTSKAHFTSFFFFKKRSWNIICFSFIRKRKWSFIKGK